MFSYEFCEIFKSTILLRTPPVAASVQLYQIWMNSKTFLIDFYYWFQISCYAEQFPFRVTPSSYLSDKPFFEYANFLNSCFFRTAIFHNSYLLTGAATKGVLYKKLILKTSQHSQKHGLQFYLKETPTQVYSYENCENFKNNYFEEHLRTAASVPSTKNPLY